MTEFPTSAPRRESSPPVTASSAPAQPAAFAPDGEVHLLDRFAVVYRYRRIAVTVFIITSAVMMIQGYTNIQLFQARGQLLIEDERSTAVPGLQGNENTFYE